MKNLKSFESMEWGKIGTYSFKSLDPEEMCLLLLWSYSRGSGLMIKSESDIIDRTRSKGSGKGDLEISYDFKGGECSVFVDFNFSGGFTPYRSATRDEPSEGGEFILEHVDVSSITFFLDGTEVVMEPKFVKEIKNLSVESANYAIMEETGGYDSEFARTMHRLIDLPEELKNKISSLGGDF